MQQEAADMALWDMHYGHTDLLAVFPMLQLLSLAAGPCQHVCMAFWVEFIRALVVAMGT